MRYEQLRQIILEKQQGIGAGIPVSREFPQLRRIIPSYNPGEQILLASGEGSGKTRMVIRLVIIECLKYMLSNPNGMKARIFYNSLELSEFEVYLILLSYLFKAKLNKIYSRDVILNFLGEPSVNEEFFQDLEKIKPSIEFFNTWVTVVDNVKDIESWYKYCTKILHDMGEIKEGVYVKKNPNILPIFIADTLNSFTVRTSTRQDTIKKYSADYSKLYLRNFYQSCVIQVQQMSKDSQSTMFSSAGKVVEEKFKPTSTALKDARDTPDDANTVISLLNPEKFKLSKWEGFDLSVFRKRILFFYHLKTNFSEMIDPFAMYTNLGTLEIEEIPNPQAHPNLYEAFLKKHGIVNTKSKFTFNPEAQSDLFLE